MKHAPFALYALALAVVLAWPLSSAIGAARARPSATGSDIQAVGCVPDRSTDAQAGGEPALPPGHPPVQGLLPPGHPPISSDAPQLPPGHPPLPSAHPPIPPALPFEAPALLTI
jgi:hypothetical protein